MIFKSFEEALLWAAQLEPGARFSQIAKGPAVAVNGDITLKDAIKTLRAQTRGRRQSSAQGGFHNA